MEEAEAVPVPVSDVATAEVNMTAIGAVEDAEAVAVSAAATA